MIKIQPPLKGGHALETTNGEMRCVLHCAVFPAAAEKPGSGLKQVSCLCASSWSLLSPGAVLLCRASGYLMCSFVRSMTSRAHPRCAARDGFFMPPPVKGGHVLVTIN